MYKLTQTGLIIRLYDFTIFSQDYSSECYRAYLIWVADGNAPLPADSAPVAAPSVTPWQFRKALNASGLRAEVDAAIQSAPQDIKDGYEFATEYRADDAVLLAMASQLGLTTQQITDFFNLAKTL